MFKQLNPGGYTEDIFDIPLIIVSFVFFVTTRLRYSCITQNIVLLPPLCNLDDEGQTFGEREGLSCNPTSTD